MDDLISKLREAKTLTDVNPILKKLGANGPVRKLVEASIFQRMSTNPASYEYGISMLNEAIQYLDKSEDPAAPESPGLKVKGDNFVKEETLDNNNSTGHSAGSEGSTENQEPYSGEGSKTPVEDMTNAPNTENQFSEIESPFPKALNEMGGLHPDIEKSVSSKMPTIPALNAGDQLKQTRYTIQNYHETVVKPLLEHSKKQDIAIKQLSQKIRETEAKAGTYSFDMDTIKHQAPARVRETIPTDLREFVASTQIPNKDFELNQRRNEIRFMNNQYN